MSWLLSGISRRRNSLRCAERAACGASSPSAPAQLGTAPRNGIVGPSYFNTDLSVFKDILLAARSKVQLRVEVFNVFNKKNYRSIDTNMTSSRFGAVTDFETPRIVQLGAKYTF